MPFDNPQPLTQDMIYRQRRDKAIALWATIPGTVFNIRRWRQRFSCDTICCALGWLAERQLDGWEYYMEVPRWRLLADYHGAAVYFGITHKDSYGLFSGSSEVSRWGSNVLKVGLQDISEALRSLPINYTMRLRFDP